MDTPSQFLKQQQKQNAQQVPVNPVGSLQKEAAPLAPVSDYLHPSELTPSLDREVEEAGVKPIENPEIPKLHVDVKNQGVTVAGEVMQPGDKKAASITQLPYTQQQILEAEKAPATDSRKWLGYIYEVIAKRLGLWKEGKEKGN